MEGDGNTGTSESMHSRKMLCYVCKILHKLVLLMLSSMLHHIYGLACLWTDGKVVSREAKKLEKKE